MSCWLKEDNGKPKDKKNCYCFLFMSHRVRIVHGSLSTGCGCGWGYTTKRRTATGDIVRTKGRIPSKDNKKRVGSADQSNCVSIYKTERTKRKGKKRKESKMIVCGVNERKSGGLSMYGDKKNRY